MTEVSNLHFEPLNRLALRHRATLVTTHDGGPIRTLVANGSRHATGRYTSAKTGRAQPWKTHLERARLCLCEVDPDVASYLAQPHRLDFTVDDRKAQFFPDLRIGMRSGEVQIERLLDDHAPQPSAESERAAEFAAEVYAGLGWKFTTLRNANVEQGRINKRRLKNARTLAIDKFVIATSSDLMRAFSCIDENGGEVAFGRLAEDLGGPPLGEAVVHALIVRGHVALDLSRILNADTAVWLPKQRRRS